MRDESWCALTGFLAFAGFGLIAAGCGGNGSGGTVGGSTILGPSPSANPSQPPSPVTTTGSSQTKKNPNPPNFPSPSPIPTSSPSPTPTGSPIPGPHLYSINSTSNNITVFHYDTGTGALSQGRDTAMPATGGGTAFWAALDSAANSSLLFVTAQGSGLAGKVVPFQVNQGILTAGTVATDAGQRPFAVAVEPTGKFVFSLDSTSGATAPGLISEYSYLATGTMTATTPPSFAVGNGPFTVVVNSAGTFLYVGNFTDNTVQAIAIASGGVLSNPAANNKIGTGATQGPNIIVLSAGNNFLFSGNGDGTVSSFPITANLLPSVAPTAVMASAKGAAGAGVLGLAVDASTSFLIAASGITGSGTTGGGDIAVLTISNTGALARPAAPINPASGATAVPADVVIDPNTKFAYVCEENVEKIEAFSITGTSIQAIAGSPFSYPATSDKGPTRLLIGN